MRARFWLMVLLLALVHTALPRSAHGDDLQEFELAKSRYDVGSYEEAVTHFGRLLDPDDSKYLADAKLRALAQPLYAASLIALGRVAEADDVIAAVLRDDPSYRPRPGLFPQEVIDRFIAMRAKLREELDEIARQRMEDERQKQLALQQERAAAAKRVAALERLAKQERVVEERSRWIAMVPFGVGQFQNGADGLGWFFAVSGAVTAAASIVSAVVAYDFASVDCRTYVDPDTGAPADCAELESSFLAARTVNWISFGSLVAVAVAGVIEAQASFEGEVETLRERELPPELRVEPAVEASETGVVFGLTGWF